MISSQIIEETTRAPEARRREPPRPGSGPLEAAAARPAHGGHALPADRGPRSSESCPPDGGHVAVDPAVEARWTSPPMETTVPFDAPVHRDVPSHHEQIPEMTWSGRDADVEPIRITLPDLPRITSPSQARGEAGGVGRRRGEGVEGGGDGTDGAAGAGRHPGTRRRSGRASRLERLSANRLELAGPPAPQRSRPQAAERGGSVAIPGPRPRASRQTAPRGSEDVESAKPPAKRGPRKARWRR